jgi:hypothetical protein
MKAEHFTRWFGHHGAKVVSRELDARPEGIIRFGHRCAGSILREHRPPGGGPSGSWMLTLALRSRRDARSLTRL